MLTTGGIASFRCTEQCDTVNQSINQSVNQSITVLAVRMLELAALRSKSVHSGFSTEGASQAQNALAPRLPHSMLAVSMLGFAKQIRTFWPL